MRKSSSGLGIGLSLVFQLVSLHGGSIKASSKGLGQGSEFVLRLPLMEIMASAAATPPMSVTRGSGAERLLIVDDNIDSADSTAMLMAAYGYEVRTAYDFESALQEAVSFIPHVALLDLSMPEPNGLELASRFRQKAETKKYCWLRTAGMGNRMILSEAGVLGLYAI